MAIRKAGNGYWSSDLQSCVQGVNPGLSSSGLSIFWRRFRGGGDGRPANRPLPLG
jgi:hypothetical protein